MAEDENHVYRKSPNKRRVSIKRRVPNKRRVWRYVR